jgi:hypothetical protein
MALLGPDGALAAQARARAEPVHTRANTRAHARARTAAARSRRHTHARARARAAAALTLPCAPPCAFACKRKPLSLADTQVLRSLGLSAENTRLASARAARGAGFRDARGLATPLAPPARLAATVGARAAAAATTALTAPLPASSAPSAQHAAVQPHHLLLALCALDASAVPVLHALLPWRAAAVEAASAAAQRGTLRLPPQLSRSLEGAALAGQPPPPAGAAALAAAAGAASAARLKRVVLAAAAAAAERRALTAAAAAALAAAGDEAVAAGATRADASAGHLLAALLREMDEGGSGSDGAAHAPQSADGAGPVLRAAGVRRSALRAALRAAAARAPPPPDTPSTQATSGGGASGGRMPTTPASGGGGGAPASATLARITSAAAAEARGVGGSPLRHSRGAVGTTHLLAALLADADSAEALEGLLAANDAEGEAMQAGAQAGEASYAQARVLAALLRRVAGLHEGAPLREVCAPIAARHATGAAASQAAEAEAEAETEEEAEAGAPAAAAAASDAAAAPPPRRRASTPAWPFLLSAWYARRAGRAATADWRAFATSAAALRPPCVPLSPAAAYAKKGFVSWAHFVAAPPPPGACDDGSDDDGSSTSRRRRGRRAGSRARASASGGGGGDASAAARDEWCGAFDGGDTSSSDEDEDAAAVLDDADADADAWAAAVTRASPSAARGALNWGMRVGGAGTSSDATGGALPLRGYRGGEDAGAIISRGR